MHLNISEPQKPTAAAQTEDDPTAAGYDEAVQTDDGRGLSLLDSDDLSEAAREQAPGEVPTLTPSPTARTDEDPSALPESNIAGEAPVQGG